MGSYVELFIEWEIQFLVLLSFTLQFFLFLTGGLRQCATDRFLIFVIWSAYLGADSVAVYSLGRLAQLEHGTIVAHELALLWASFLLIHLGGQDTITAFAIEDNNLWRRHLLNLVVQATLVLYVFWKSIGVLDTRLLVACILLFATGTIRYGERTWALWSGSLRSLASSTVPDYVREQWTPIGRDACYSDVVNVALHSVQGVRDVFGDIGFYHRSVSHGREASTSSRVHPRLLPMLLEVELGLMFDDIYTKATVLRTRGGIMLRGLSQTLFLVAFALFVSHSKQRKHNNNNNNNNNNYPDAAITYALFAGGFFLEAYAIFITVMSPWTWAWLRYSPWRRRHCGFLASISIGWQRKRMLWSNSMGQYSLLNYLGQYCCQHDKQPIKSPLCLCRQRVMAVMRKLVNVVCGTPYKKLCISKLFDTRFVEVEEEIMSGIVQRIVQFRSEGSSVQQWPNLRPLLHELFLHFPFEETIIMLHIYTEVQLSTTATAAAAAGVGTTLPRVCRKLSNYMLYLLAVHPEMLPVKRGSERTLAGTLDDFPTITMENLGNDRSILGDNNVILRRAIQMLGERSLPVPPQVCTEAAPLLEIQEAWTRLLIYAACKSRPEMHAAQLAGGGELLTFAWLLAAHHLIGDVGNRIEIADIFNMEETRIKIAHDNLLYD